MGLSYLDGVAWLVERLARRLVGVVGAGRVLRQVFRYRYSGRGMPCAHSAGSAKRIRE